MSMQTTLVALLVGVLTLAVVFASTQERLSSSTKLHPNASSEQSTLNGTSNATTAQLAVSPNKPPPHLAIHVNERDAKDEYYNTNQKMFKWINNHVTIIVIVVVVVIIIAGLVCVFVMCKRK